MLVYNMVTSSEVAGNYFTEHYRFFLAIKYSALLTLSVQHIIIVNK